MRVLVVAAHPDDEVLGVGGTVAKHVKNGENVQIIILGEGAMSRDNADKSKVEELREDSKKALAILGVNDVYYYDFPDNKFDTIPLLDIIKTVERHVKEFKPNRVYTHFWGDLNIDHQITYKAVITACRPINGVNEILLFEILSSTEQNVQTQQNVFSPNHFEDILETLEQKIKAMKEYKTEIKEYPHPRSEEGIRILAKYRGLFANTTAAEGFTKVR